MDLFNQMKQYLPKSEGPTKFDPLLENLKKTNELTDNDQVKKLAEDESKAANDITGTLVGVLEKINPISSFLPENEQASEALDTGNEQVSELNDMLGKIAGLNCITKFCMLAKYLKKVQDLIKKLEEFKKKLEEQFKEAQDKAMDWAKAKAAEMMKGKATEVLSSAAASAGAAVKSAVGNMKIW